MLTRTGVAAGAAGWSAVTGFVSSAAAGGCASGSTDADATPGAAVSVTPSAKGPADTGESVGGGRLLAGGGSTGDGASSEGANAPERTKAGSECVITLFGGRKSVV